MHRNYQSKIAPLKEVDIEGVSREIVRTTFLHNLVIPANQYDFGRSTPRAHANLNYKARDCSGNDISCVVAVQAPEIASHEPKVRVERVCKVRSNVYKT